MAYLISNFRVVFLAAVLSGAFVIIAFGEYHAQATLASLTIMGMFGIVVWKKLRSELASESDVDSFYYLGFLLTLATLVSAFWPYMPFGNKADASVTEKDVLGLFGLGLFTTFAGLAGRIVLSQVPQGRNTDLAVAADTLAASYLNLAEELRKAAEEVARQRAQLSLEISQITDIAENVTEQYQKRVGDSLEGFFKIVRQRVAQTAVEMVNVTAGLGTELKGGSELITETAEAIRANTQKLRRAVGQLAERVEQTNTSLQGLSNGLELLSAARAPIAEAAEEARENVKAIRECREEMVTELQASNQAVLQVHRQLVQAADQLATHVEARRPR